MNLDLYTVSLLTTLVVAVSSIIFLVGMLIRKDEGAGRTWGLAFLLGLLTVISYLVWATTPNAWWAIAVGNAAYVSNLGCMWLGCRAFNRRPMLVSIGIVALAALAAFGAVAIEGAEGGDWTGAPVFFTGIAVFSAMGAAESLRGEMGENRIAWGLSATLALVAAFFAVRTVVFVVAGVESETFVLYFDTVPASVLTITLAIIAVVVTSVLLSGRTRLTASVDPSKLSLSDDDVLPEVSFAHVLLDMTGRARRRSELVGVVSLRIDDLPAIATAFGGEAAASVGAAFRTVVRRFAPTTSFVGQDGPTGLMVGIQPESATDARRLATRIRRGLFDELSGVVGVVIPVVGVGIALSETTGYEPATLMRAARDAAKEAARSTETTVVVAS